MAEISKITLPSGQTYDIKDATARSQIEALTGGDAVVFIGVSSVELTDGGNQTPKINGENKTPATGQLFFYGTQEFIYGNDNKWHALGSLESLGSLAYKNSAIGTYKRVTGVTVTTNATTNKTATVAPATSGEATYTPDGTISFSNTNKTATVSPAASGTVTYTPAGTVATSNQTFAVTGSAVPQGGTANYTPNGSVGTPTISLKTAGSTTKIKNPTSVTVAKTVVAAAPGTAAPANAITYYSVSDETLSLYQLGYTTGASITTSDVTVKTGDAAYQSSQPSFTGTGTMLTTATIKEPTGEFNGTGVRLVTGNISVPSNANFTGTGVRLVTGNIAVPNTYTANITETDTTISVS